MIDVITSFSYPEAITVQIRTADGDLDECNHAGAEEQTYMHERYSHDLEDVLQDEYNLLTCDKTNCNAIYHEYDREWSTS